MKFISAKMSLNFNPQSFKNFLCDDLEMTYTGSVFTYITRSRFCNRGVLTLKMTCFLSYLEHFGTVTQRFFWMQNPDDNSKV